MSVDEMRERQRRAMEFADSQERGSLAQLTAGQEAALWECAIQLALMNEWRKA